MGRDRRGGGFRRRLRRWRLPLRYFGPLAQLLLLRGVVEGGEEGRGDCLRRSWPTRGMWRRRFSG